MLLKKPALVFLGSGCLVAFLFWRCPASERGTTRGLFPAGWRLGQTRLRELSRGFCFLAWRLVLGVTPVPLVNRNSNRRVFSVTNSCMGCGRAIAAEFLGIKKDYSPCRLADGLFCRRYVRSLSCVRMCNSTLAFTQRRKRATGGAAVLFRCDCSFFADARGEVSEDERSTEMHT